MHYLTPKDQCSVIQSTLIYFFILPQIGIEPIHPLGSRFTVCRNSPALPLRLISPRLGIKPSSLGATQWVIISLPWYISRDWNRTNLDWLMRPLCSPEHYLALFGRWGIWTPKPRRTTVFKTAAIPFCQPSIAP